MDSQNSALSVWFTKRFTYRQISENNTLSQERAIFIAWESAFTD
jgi:hypothetical protein